MVLYLQRHRLGFWGGRFVCAGIDHLALSVQRPESVFENIVRIVTPFDFTKPFPVLSETAFRTFCGLVTAQELSFSVKRVVSCGQFGARTLGKGPPKATRPNVSDIH